MRPPRGTMTMRVWQTGLNMGIPAARILRPDWTPARLNTPMDVDHVVELQCLTNADHVGIGNVTANYEILDRSTNRSSGSVIRDGIARERWDMYIYTLDPSWLTVSPLTFEAVRLEPGTPQGERWSYEAIDRGDHYATWRRLHGLPPNFGVRGPGR